MSEVPTGTVTLVFTDIQGSTSLWEYLGVDFKSVLDQHNELFRSAIKEFNGYEVKTEGDGFIIAFRCGVEAVSMCLAMQVRLQAKEWPDSLNDEAISAFAGTTEDGCFRGLRVRMGVHTGTPVSQRDPVTGRMDYFGSMVNRAARVGAVGYGGQLVVSGATWEAVASQLPKGTAIEDLGEHALKGFERREYLRQLLPAELSERSFPRLKTPNLKNTNLPTRLDSFFGREPEIYDLKRRIADGQRLITVLGAGGTGKSRLAQRLGGTQLGSFPGGVWFCDLSEARSSAEILTSMGTSLEVPLTSRDPEFQLASALLGLGRVLVILDNFEQVVDHATDTVTRWLQRAPEAVFLVTSRRLLRISGEEVLYLAPLPVSEAVSLFFDRARAVQPGFTRTDKNEPVVTEIVERLDGMSLAIELAAARVRMLPAEKILQRLSQRFKLLRGQRRDQSARQATLRGAIDWSWELLEPCEQSALSQLSMFRGGCTLEAAEAVVNLDAFGEEPLVMDVVEALVDHSLLRRVEPYSGHVRYRMLESIREYSAEKLDIEMAPTALRHAQHFSSFGDEAYAYSLETHGGVERRKGMALELENLLGGVDAGLAAGEPEVAAGCALAGAEVFIMHGPYADGVALLERVSGQVLDRGTQGRLIQKAGYLLGFAGRSTEALEHFQEALSRHREVGNRLVEGSTLRNLGNLHREQGRTSEALEHYQKALVIAREVGNKRGEGVALGSLGNLHKAQGRILEALEHYQQAVAIFRGVGDGRGEGVNIGNLGDLLSSQGDLVSGGTHLRDAIAICDETWPSAAGAFRGSLALILAQQGDFGEARSLVEQGEPQVRDVYKLEFGKLLCKKSQVESLAGDSTAAASALAEAEAIATEVMADPGSELGVALAEARVAQGHG